MNGQKFTRTNNTKTTKCYLENISKDYGKNKLVNILSAIEQYIDYYENIQNPNMHKIRKIFEEFQSKIDFILEIVYPDEINCNLTEGSKKEITINAYERHKIGRKKLYHKVTNEPQRWFVYL